MWKCLLSNTTCTTRCNSQRDRYKKGRRLPSFFLQCQLDVFRMNRFAFFVGFIACVQACAGVYAAEPVIYRCGNTYTNQPVPGASCRPVTSGNVTVIEGLRVNPVPVASPTGAAASATKVDKAEQQQRDSQAAAVLQNELQRAQARHAELLREWNQGEPERLADERRQPQKYQERVQSLKAAIARSEADLAGLQRELARLNANAGAAKP